jgi:hypothetical protein
MDKTNRVGFAALSPPYKFIFVTTGLDPVVHADSPNGRRGRMDCRVKPGNDDLALRKVANPSSRPHGA